ncbi:MAG: DUF4178 domain-containing protein [Myxococcota bacterium]
MAAAQGNCPSCGAPIEFSVGSSISKVCEYCRHTVLRSDRGLTELGKVSDLTDVPSLIAVGDEGTLAGRPFRVMGRVQLDHGKGPWDEYYVAFDYGQSWGWLAFAQGRWFTTSPVAGVAVPPFGALSPEAEVMLGAAGRFRVAEVRTGRIVSAEGELPGAFPAGFERAYADLAGANSAFATLDYGDQSQPPIVFLGWEFPESALSVTQLGPRSANKVRVTALKCPNCGGDVPALLPGRSERLGCPYCGAVSDIAGRTVIAQQEKARSLPVIPIGTRGSLDGVDYISIAALRRGSYFEGELYEWEEFLLWSQGVGFRWLVLDPETGWSFVTPVNLAELDFTERPFAVSYVGRRFEQRNQNRARVLYVLGEVYWKCEVGETVEVSDFTAGSDVLSREASATEVNWSLSQALSWAKVAQAFNLSLAEHARHAGKAKKSSFIAPGTLLLIIAVVVILCIVIASAPSGPSYGGGVGVGSYRGGGVFSGGK